MTEPRHVPKADCGRAALNLWPSCEDWKPITSAPQDGSRLVLYVPPYGISTGHWETTVAAGDTVSRWNCHSVLNRDAVPTHWMLPKPPRKGNEENERLHGRRA